MRSAHSIPGNAKDLCDLSESADRFNLPSTELSNAQLVAVDERFQAAKKDIKLVRLRAEEAGLERIRSFDDLVQLLLRARVALQLALRRQLFQLPGQ